ncbi:uncharacterized protein (TIGR02678 family) [Actinoplanes tereljensis]|uniref:TIGR02678 family protein n=1 Tax=Paractinoplanes tereljensis TaxID=571912 RepID=A0A919TX32_9ACTN|nr:TIGR02678 family protein [Actinoplanes tereljensis]GIF26688.1 hypothetical protein Ate02nite_94180 [Actinoplanes tereljensis]
MAEDLDIALATERRRAVRALLANPLLLTEHPDFPLVRRHAEWLKSWFGNFLGYRLVVEAGFARLFKAGMEPGRGRPLRRSTGPFTPRMYAYLTLAVAVLLTGPEQVLLSNLVADIRAAAVEAGIDLDDAQRQTERRALGAAIRQLVAWTALREDQGTVAGYAEDDQAEALLTVNRDIVAHLLATPPGRASTPEEFIQYAAEAGPGGPRHAVRRRLVEQPVTYVDDLTDDERTWLRREQRRDERAWLEYAGLQAEIRAEGVALLDPEDELTDMQFPGSGTVAQAALLAIGDLVTSLRPEPGPLTTGVPLPIEELDRVLAALTERHARRWAGRYLEDPLLLREEVVALLIDMGILARGNDFLLLAAAARYAATEELRS